MQHLTHPSLSSHLPPPSFSHSVCASLSLTGRWESDSSILFNSIKLQVCLGSPQFIICSWWEELFNVDGTWASHTEFHSISSSSSSSSSRESQAELPTTVPCCIDESLHDEWHLPTSPKSTKWTYCCAPFIRVHGFLFFESIRILVSCRV